MFTPEPRIHVIPKQRVAGNSYGREDAIRTLHCIDDILGCGREITEAEYHSWDTETKAEYGQSGWCNDCQDKVFNDGCSCTSVDVGIGVITNEDPLCETHGDPDYFDIWFDYDPDMREDDPPHDINDIEWTGSYV